MRKYVILAAVIMCAIGAANCGGSNPDSAGSSIIAPAGTDGKPGATSGSSTNFAMKMVTDANGDGLPNWADRVTFEFSQTATTTPRVDLTCSQNGVLVMSATTGFFADYPWPWTQVMKLASPSWTSGGADCTAILYYYGGGRKNVVLATTKFTAYE